MPTKEYSATELWQMTKGNECHGPLEKKRFKFPKWYPIIGFKEIKKRMAIEIGIKGEF